MASIPLKNWNTLSITEKLNFTKQTLKISTNDELCKVIGVTPQTLYRWQAGSYKPTRKHLKRLYDICHMYEWGSDMFNKDVYISQFTTAYDAAKTMYERILAHGDDISKSNVIHSVSVKIAHLLSDKLKKDHKKDALIYMHSVYGAEDYGEIINIQSTDLNGNLLPKKADLCIKIGNIDKTPEIVYIMECAENNNMKVRRGGYISDAGIIKLVSYLVNFFKK